MWDFSTSGPEVPCAPRSRSDSAPGAEELRVDRTPIRCHGALSHHLGSSGDPGLPLGCRDDVLLFRVMMLEVESHPQ